MADSFKFYHHLYTSETVTVHKTEWIQNEYKFRIEILYLFAFRWPLWLRMHFIIFHFVCSPVRHSFFARARDTQSHSKLIRFHFFARQNTISLIIWPFESIRSIRKNDFDRSKCGRFFFRSHFWMSTNAVISIYSVWSMPSHNWYCSCHSHFAPIAFLSFSLSIATFNWVNQSCARCCLCKENSSTHRDAWYVDDKCIKIVRLITSLYSFFVCPFLSRFILFVPEYRWCCGTQHTGAQWVESTSLRDDRRGMRHGTSDMRHTYKCESIQQWSN